MRRFSNSPRPAGFLPAGLSVRRELFARLLRNLFDAPCEDARAKKRPIGPPAGRSSTHPRMSDRTRQRDEDGEASSRRTPESPRRLLGDGVCLHEVVDPVVRGLARRRAAVRRETAASLSSAETPLSLDRVKRWRSPVAEKERAVGVRGSPDSSRRSRRQRL